MEPAINQPILSHWAEFNGKNTKAQIHLYKNIIQKPFKENIFAYLISF